MSAFAVRRSSRLLTTSVAFIPALAAIALAALVAATGCAATPGPRPTAQGTGTPKTGTPKPVQSDPYRVALRAQLAAARAQQIARLRDYRIAGFFPTNRVDPNNKLNVFIDPDTGALCAVANLIAQAGQGQIVYDAADKNNFLRLADVHDGPLYDWVLHSGLTQEEVVLIQEPYEPYVPQMAQAEIERLQAHFLKVEEQLLRDNEASLDLAVDRLAASMV